jgi:hypothetical protein
LDKNLSNFLGLWQGRAVTDKKKVASPTSLDPAHHIPKFGQEMADSTGFSVERAERPQQAHGIL